LDRILLGHGSGGRLMHGLIEKYFAPAFGLSELMDSAVLENMESGRLAFTTDSYVVSPLFFPGGDIGSLAVNGTVNDLSMVGAKPLYLTAGFILEEGFPIKDMEAIVSSMASAAEKAGVKVVAGDTKVVDRGKGDGIFINTSGLGILYDGVNMSAKNIRDKDGIIISGEIGSHGIAVLAERNGLSFEPRLQSDTFPLNGLVAAMLSVTKDIRIMRDPTRGGLATSLKEFALESGLSMTVYEEEIPVAPGVRGACEIMGLDPLYVANEGVLIAVAPMDMAQYIIEEMRRHEGGREARIIGEVMGEPAAAALLKTKFGGTRMLELLPGEQLPRIC
jgi:hydrogenase expression/formation protein HypE